MRNSIIPGLLIFFITLISCNKELEYVYNPIHSEDYLMYKEVSNNDTIMLLAQGGPTDELTSKEFIGDLLDFFPYNVAMVHQTQTKDPSILDQYFITDEEAEEINNRSADILNGVIEDFKSQGKHVIVFGASFGSFLGLRTIERHGLTADQYALLIGRVDMPEEFSLLFRERRYGFYGSGVDIEASKYISEQASWATTKLLGNIGQPQYSQLLSDVDLSSLVYRHRLQDENVGKLQEAEIQFLEGRGASVSGTPGSHRFDETDYAVILEFIRR